MADGAAQARADARRVLEGDRYRARDVPRPLEGVLRWIGERVRSLGDVVGDVLSTPAGVVGTVAVVATVTVLAVAAATRRRTRRADEAVRASRRGIRADPNALDREADGAEAAGDLAGAVRLRFRAGILRLEDAGAIPARPDATTRRLLAVVPAPAFASLARTFDAVAYGGRPAVAADVEAARRDWPVVHGEVAHRALAGDASTPTTAGGPGDAGRRSDR